MKQTKQSHPAVVLLLCLPHAEPKFSWQASLEKGDLFLRKDPLTTELLDSAEPSPMGEKGERKPTAKEARQRRLDSVSTNEGEEGGKDSFEQQQIHFSTYCLPTSTHSFYNDFHPLFLRSGLWEDHFTCKKSFMCVKRSVERAKHCFMKQKTLDFSTILRVQECGQRWNHSVENQKADYCTCSSN